MFEKFFDSDCRACTFIRRDIPKAQVGRAAMGCNARAANHVSSSEATRQSRRCSVASKSLYHVWELVL